MPWVLIRQKIKDYQQWRRAFDGDEALLHDSGALGGRVFLNVDQPDEVIVILKWRLLDAARDFMRSEAFEREMQRAGVEGRPEVYFLDELEKPVL